MLFRSRKAAKSLRAPRRGGFLAALSLPLLFALGPAPASAAYTGMYAFGDSLSDTGNVTLAAGVPIAPYAPGRFSNGKVWVESVAFGLGVPILPSLGGGTNYAFGGSPTGDPLTSGFGSMAATQLPSFLGAVGGVADPNALYSVYGGGNDVRLNNPFVAAGNIAGIVDALYSAGARHFIVPNLPDIGITPEAVLGGTSVPATLASQCVNFGGTPCDILAGSAIGLLGLDDYFGPGSAFLAARPGIKVTLLDVYAFVNNILAAPGAFGFTNVTDACYTGTTGVGGGGTVCANPDEYLFWDGIHPTAAAHQLLGLDAYSQVIPVPGAVWLFASALAGLGWLRRRAA